MVRAVPAVVVTTMAAVDIDLPVAPVSPVMPVQVLATTVVVPVTAATAALVTFAGRADTMAAAAFAVAVALAAPVLPAPAPMTLVTMHVALVAPTPAVSPSSSNDMVRNKKLYFTCNLPVYLANTVRQIKDANLRQN